MKLILLVLIIVVSLNGCGFDFETTPTHLNEQDVIDYIWVEPIPEQLANYYGNPNASFELSSPILWENSLIVHGVDWDIKIAKYFKINKDNFSEVEEWDSFANVPFISFQPNSIIAMNLLIFAYPGGPLTVIDLNSMSTIYKSNFRLSSRNISLINDFVIVETIVDEEIIHKKINLIDFSDEFVFKSTHNNNQIFGLKQIPEFTIDQDGVLEAIAVEKTNDTTYYIQKINTVTLDTIWRTLSDQKNANNGPYHIQSDENVVLASSYGYVSVYSKMTGEHMYTLKRGQENRVIEEPIIFQDYIISPTDISIGCYSKSDGSLIWEHNGFTQIFGSYLGWGSSFENSVIEEMYFVGKFPIDVNSGELLWQFMDGEHLVDFTGLPAIDTTEGVLYYTGAEFIYKIALP